MGRLQGIFNRIDKKMAIIIAMLLLAIIIAFIIFLIARPTESEDKNIESVTYTVDTVHMEQTLTAAGKVTTGPTQNVDLDKGKRLKLVCVSKKEAVRQGQALVYYTDGTHTDAPIDSVISGIHAPKNGSVVSDSHSISFNNIQDLFLKVTVPEDQINNVSKGDTAEIVINAKPHQKFFGEIVDKKDISNSLLSKEKQKASEEQTEEGDSEEPEGEEDSVDIDEDEESEDSAEDEEFDEEEYDEESESNDAYYAVNIKFDNDGTIKPGMSAGCIITISNRDDVLAVPIEAVHFDNDGNAFVIGAGDRDGEEIAIKTGSSDAMNVEIKEGLKKGDQIKYDKH